MHYQCIIIIREEEEVQKRAQGLGGVGWEDWGGRGGVGGGIREHSHSAFKFDGIKCASSQQVNFYKQKGGRTQNKQNMPKQQRSHK